MSADIQIICPITLEPIRHAVCTCFGSVYEKDAITKWLEENVTDPSTGLALPNLRLDYLCEITNSEQIEYVRVESQLIRQLTQDLMDNNKISFFYFHHTPFFYTQLLEQQSNINLLADWNVFDAMKRDFFVSDTYVNSCYITGTPDHVIDKLHRPYNTGFGFQFINLSNVTKQNGGYKSERFDFADLTNCFFNKCDFSRCTFIGAKLEGCTFVNCNFIGEQVSFYKATGVPRFINCRIERGTKWQTVTSKHDVEEVLTERLLDDYLVIVL